MNSYGKNMKNYGVDLSFSINEDRIRSNEEIIKLLKEIFDADNYKFVGARVIYNECKHEEWERGITTVIDPDGGYYGGPCYRVEYICPKCGMKKYEEK